MIASAIISLREGLEAALIIGIVYGAVKRTGRTDLRRPLWLGVATAILLSLLTAALLRAVDAELEGQAEQIFEGLTFLLAACVLTWMILWLRRQSGGMAGDLTTDVNRAASLGGRGGIFFLALISVVREGIELAIYITAISLTSSGVQTLLGAAIGLLVAILFGYLIFTTSLHLNLKRFFQLTAVILVLFAAGLIAHSVAEFNEAGVIPAIISPIWNLNPLLKDDSFLGTVFSTLFGYHGTPSLTEAIGYGVYLLGIAWVLLRKRALAAR